MEIVDLLIANELLRDLQVAKEAVRDERQVLPITDPFTLSNRAFIKRFRVSKDLARDITQVVTPFMQAPQRRSGSRIERKVLIALRFLGFGSYQEITGSNSYTAVSQATVSRALNEFCKAMLQNEIFGQWVHFPENLEEMQRLRTTFYEKYQLPGIIGYIDCTHVAIVRPSNNDPLHPEHIYVNRKSYHSINVQLICDADLRILNVNARFPGSSHDGHIWRESQVSHIMEQIYRRDNENPFFLIADSGYALRPWLLTPLEDDPIPGSPADRFNRTFLTARCTIERCNGVLKNRFRCLLKYRTLHYKPDVASKIINTCVILHNMCLSYNVPEPEYDEEVLNDDFGIYNERLEDFEENVNFARVNLDLQNARNLQRRIIQTHFRL